MVDSELGKGVSQEEQDRAQIDLLLAKTGVKEALHNVVSEFDELPGDRRLHGIRPDGMVVLLQQWQDASVNIELPQDDTEEAFEDFFNRTDEQWKLRAIVLDATLPADEISKQRLLVDFTMRDAEGWNDGSIRFPGRLENGSANVIVREAVGLTPEQIHALDVPSNGPLAQFLQRTGGFVVPGEGGMQSRPRRPTVGGRPLYPLILPRKK